MRVPLGYVISASDQSLSRNPTVLQVTPNGEHLSHVAIFVLDCDCNNLLFNFKRVITALVVKANKLFDNNYRKHADNLVSIII